CPIGEISLHFLSHSQNRSKKKSLQTEGIPACHQNQDFPSILVLMSTKKFGIFCYFQSGAD
ncbi:unnamed protein product, partial [Staurois parvus]